MIQPPQTATDINVAAVVCAQCARVRVGDLWRAARPVGRVSHSICPSCADRLYGTGWSKRRGA